MRTGISFTVSPSDRARLTALTGNRNSPQKHVWRAEIVLLSADGAGTVEIMRRTGKSKTCVWRWQERFAEEGEINVCSPVLAKMAQREKTLTLPSAFVSTAMTDEMSTSCAARAAESSASDSIAA